MKLGLLLLAALPSFAATNIAFTDANLKSFNWGANGGSSYEANAQDAAVYFTVNIGTSTLKVTLFGTEAFNCQIDGGSTIVITPSSSSALTLQTISSSLSAGSHSVYCWGSDLDTNLSTAAAFVTDGTGTVANSSFGTVYAVSAAPFITYGKVTDTPWTTISNNGYPSFPYTRATGVLDFSSELGARYYATGSAQSIYVYSDSGNATAWELYQDGVDVGTGSSETNGGCCRLLTVSGLDPGQHLYEWVLRDIAVSASGLIYVMTNGALAAVAVPARIGVGLCGDSIGALSHIATGDSRLAWWAATHATGFDLERQAQGGATASAFGLASCASAMTGGQTPLPKIVIEQLGVNDQGTGVEVATFQAAVGTILSNTGPSMPSGGAILWEQILPNATTNSSLRGTYNAAIVAAVASYNAGSPAAMACTYNTDGWIDPAIDADDGLHPGLQNAPEPGYPFGNPLQNMGKVSNRLSFIFQGYQPASSSISLTGPASGFNGHSSATFTIAPVVAGAVFSGEIITPSDGAAGGTFTPSTVTTSAGSAIATFTYMPSSTGAKTITLTALPDCWTAPAGLSYTSGALPASEGAAGVAVSGGVLVQ